jgi:hypothetical protein
MLPVGGGTVTAPWTKSVVVVVDDGGGMKSSEQRGSSQPTSANSAMTRATAARSRTRR